MANTEIPNNNPEKEPISDKSIKEGKSTKGGPKEVGTSTTGAVVMTLVTVSLMDVVLTQILFG